MSAPDQDLLKDPQDEAGQQTTASLEAPSTRRAFLWQASALSLAIPGLGVAIASCAPGHKESTGAAAAGAPVAGATPGAVTRHNPDSKLDSSLHTAGASGTVPNSGAAAVAYHRFDPVLPPLSAERTLRLQFTAQETPIRISDDTVVAGWTFNGDTPGPIVHCRVGDTVEFTLTNEAVMPHSMDFHAAQINPKVAFRSVAKGESVTFTFKPKYAGAFLYHCGSAPVLLHIGSGMYGAIIVSPEVPLAPAKEFVLVEGEMYLGPAVNGVRPFDYTKMLSTLPDFVMFNGRPDQYAREPIHVKVGDRVRFWVVNAGPTHACSFHVVGEQFDTVYLGTPPNNAIHGVQTFGVVAGGGMCFELVCDVPGEFPVVNHAFGHGQKGAIGYLVVDS